MHDAFQAPKAKPGGAYDGYSAPKLLFSREVLRISYEVPRNCLEIISKDTSGGCKDGRTPLGTSWSIPYMKVS